MNRTFFDRPTVWMMVVLAALAVLVPMMNIFVPETSPLHLETYTVSLLGKYLCYAILALSVDLIWGYLGILSLGHGAFSPGWIRHGHVPDAPDWRSWRLW